MSSTFVSYGYAQALAGIVQCWSVAPVMAVPSDCSAITAITPAAIVIERCMHHRKTINSPAHAWQPQSFASKSAAGRISTNQLHPNQSGSTKGATKPCVIKLRRSKHRPSKHAFANQYQHNSSPIMSAKNDVTSMQ